MDLENQKEAKPLRSTPAPRPGYTKVFVIKRDEGGPVAKVCDFFCSAIVTLILLALWNLLSITAIVIGAIYLDQDNCPAKPHMAPMLIAAGCLAIFVAITEGAARYKGKGAASQGGCWACLVGLAGFVNFCLFIYLSVMVFDLLPNVRYNKIDLGPGRYYCNHTLFLFTFWNVVITLISLLATVIIGCCACCCGCFCAKKWEVLQRLF